METPKQMTEFLLFLRYWARSRRWPSSDRLKVALRSGGGPGGFRGGGGGTLERGGGERTGATLPGTYPGDGRVPLVEATEPPLLICMVCLSATC